MSTKSPFEYGTIGTTTTTTASTAIPSSPSNQNLSFFSTVTTTPTRSVSSTRRPWRAFLNLSSFTYHTPSSYSDALSRAKLNLAHFRVNYALVTLLVLFLALIYHPFSMIVFLLVFVAWFFFFFFRDSPVVAFWQSVDDRVVLGVLGFVTVFALVFTGVGLNVLVALIVAVVVLGLHACFRSTDDLFLDEESAVEGGLVSVVAGQQLRPTSYSYTRI